MSANTTLNPGTGGDVIQTEDNGGVKIQIVKLAFGPTGTVTLLGASNPLPVTSTQLPTTLGAKTAANSTSVTFATDNYLNLKDSSGNELLTVDLDNTATVTKVLGVTWRTLANGTTQEVGVIASNVYSRDTLDTTILYGQMNATTTATEAKVGASRQSVRKMLLITPATAGVFWGSDASVTVSTGTPLMAGVPNEIRTSLGVFLIAAATINCRIVEGV